MRSLSAAASEAAPVTNGPLPPDIAARTGGEQIRVDSVVRIARSQGISLREARERAIDDALFAAAMRANPANTARVAMAERSVLARAVVEHVRDDALRLGPPSDEEVRVLTEQRWPELDRPVSVRTTHAVVLVKSTANQAAARCPGRHARRRRARRQE